MKITNTGFEGLMVLEPKVFGDTRGFFYESWRLADYQQWGIQENFLQDNISVSHQNVLRGLHLRRDQGQLVTVVHGRVFDVAVDCRPNAKTFGQYFSITLQAEEGKQLYMPPGFAHGFCVLSESAIIHYKCTQYYDAQHEEGILWNDPAIGIAWPAVAPILSDRDKKFRLFFEVLDTADTRRAAKLTHGT